MIIFAVIVVAMICAGILASKKRRNVPGWVILCGLMPIAILPLLCLDPLAEQ